jgi:hypothetical protein
MRISAHAANPLAAYSKRQQIQSTHGQDAISIFFLCTVVWLGQWQE